MKPLTLKQSKAICEDFQFLKGQLFNNIPTDEKVVDCIAIAPFDEINKWIFINYYAEYQDVEKALEYYCGPFYDVLVISKLQGDFGMHDYCDLRTYLQKHALAFNVNDYAEF